MTYENTWDLESIFPGGTRSEALQTKLQETREEMKDYEHLLDTWDFNVDDAPVDTLKMILQKQDKIKKAIKQSTTFRSEEHTSELQSRGHLVCRLLLEKKKRKPKNTTENSTNKIQNIQKQ